ncbi:hypothetical protein RHMOL_Rhmol03G0051900 [Rhododendron molle]|uniref:Uncharacterized protein n=1 Tax=Rhododendron molle TaxID=49168 RepID=A0ACC0PAS6_RHOML|nr:hypothetical protein RHMOL_Rhmol03G0051900 [Rhododendron molle]
MGGASRFTMLLTTPSPFLLRLARRRRLPSSPSLSPLSTLSPTPRPQLRLIRPVQAKAGIHTQTTTTTKQDDNNRDSLGFSPTSPPPPAAHPWPEWSALVDSLSSRGYLDPPTREILADDAFVAHEELSDEFVRASSACLAFARDRTDLMGLLSRSDIGMVVETGTPFLFKSALDTTRRMRAFLGIGAGNEYDSNKEHTVDLMKYLLSYASNPTLSSEKSNLRAEGPIESAIRNLLSELTRLGFGIPAPESCASAQHQFLDRYGQTPRPLGQNTEMKRGDWICSRCTFMNFARNVKCLKCEEARPKRQLTGGEWECPQCDFFNYGRNPLCIRCDCKRPVDTSFGIIDSSSVSGHGNGLYANKPDIESRLAANEEKAQRWFTKASQLESASDLSSAAADEDFPEIMPLRKGVNRFVVSTRKTPLERRLANSQFQRDAANNKQNAETASSPSLSRSTSQHKKNSRSLSSPMYKRKMAMEQTSSTTNFVPFVPFPPDYFAKRNNQRPHGADSTVKATERRTESTDLTGSSTKQPESQSSRSGWTGKSLEGSAVQEPDPLDMSEEAKAQRWFRRVAQIKDISELSQIPDEDFPSIMPMRKGVNRFVVSKRKTPLERRLTSPQYRRNLPPYVRFSPPPPSIFGKSRTPRKRTTFRRKVTLHEVEEGMIGIATRPGGLQGCGAPPPVGDPKPIDFASPKAEEGKKQVLHGIQTGATEQHSKSKHSRMSVMSDERESEVCKRVLPSITNPSSDAPIHSYNFPSLWQNEKTLNSLVVCKNECNVELRFTDPNTQRWPKIGLSNPFKDLHFLVMDLARHTHQSAWHSMHNVICGSAKSMDKYLDALNGSGAKVHIMHGTQDQLIPPECSFSIKMKVPHTQLNILPNADHITVILDREKHFTRDLERIWASASGVRIGE